MARKRGLRKLRRKESERVEKAEEKRHLPPLPI